MLSSKKLELKCSVEITKKDLQSLTELIVKEHGTDEVIRTRLLPSNSVLYCGDSFVTHPNNYFQVRDNIETFFDEAKDGKFYIPPVKKLSLAQIIARKIAQ